MFTRVSSAVLFVISAKGVHPCVLLGIHPVLGLGTEHAQSTQAVAFLLCKRDESLARFLPYASKQLLQVVSLVPSAGMFGTR